MCGSNSSGARCKHSTGAAPYHQPSMLAGAMQVPASWQQRSYPSQQSLAPWVSGLAKRVNWLRRWLTEGTPNSFWLSGE
jgi:dynein heavy chain